MDAVFFTIIIDDIVTHEGRTMMEQLGGGGPQSIFGYQVSGENTARVGLSSTIGPDGPQIVTNWLKSYDVTTEGLIQSEHATPRAWQLFEADGLRTQVWRTRYADESLYASMLRPPWKLMARTLKNSSAYHIGIHPERFEIDLLTSLKTRSALCDMGGSRSEIAPPPRSELPWVSAETFTQATRPISTDRLQELLRVVDIFSPNLVEAESMLGTKDPNQIRFRLKAPSRIQLKMLQKMIETLLNAGGRTVAIRMGADGSLLARPGEYTIHVPAASCSVVDVTGCGNAFNGGLLRSLMRGDSLACAGAWGSAAAASMAESEGIPQGLPDEYVAITRQRWKDTRPRVRTLVTAVAQPKPWCRRHDHRTIRTRMSFCLK